jgi:S-sulfosulfanyl-L-cysteine sulfohydrolase
MTGAEIIQMLEENLERTFSADPMKQMGGYVKRCLGLYVKMRIENPEGHRIQQIFIGNEPLVPEKTYKAAFATTQGVPEKFGKNRQNLTIKAIDAMAQYLINYPDYSLSKESAFSLV